MAEDVFDWIRNIGTNLVCDVDRCARNPTRLRVQDLYDSLDEIIPRLYELEEDLIQYRDSLEEEDE